MNDWELAQLKDDILGMIVDKEHGADILWLHHNINRERLTRDYLGKILEEMNSFEIDIITLTMGQTHHIRITPKTKAFLTNGGFVNHYDSDREADMGALKLAAQKQAIRDLQERNLALSNQVAAMRLKTYWIPLIISGISAIIAAISLWYAVSTSSNSVSAVELQTVRDSVLQNGE